jgi:hypothetical protein
MSGKENARREQGQQKQIPHPRSKSGRPGSG